MRQLQIIVILVVLPAFIYIIRTKQPETTEAHVKIHDTTNIKYILYWTGMGKRKDFYLGFGSDMLKSCPVNNCFTTDNKSLINVEDFAAIIFHGPEYQYDIHGMPSKRSPNQIYVFGNKESPIHHKLHHDFENFFNWTMTYRLDSDILRNYGKWFPSRKQYKMPKKSEIESRPKKIAWFVSNCRSTNNRELLYRQINKHIPVDVFGKCGNLTCNNTEEDCLDLLEKNYKFYLSFENSICEDYVTEKLYSILRKNVVPIVYGGVDYNQAAPPHSVIDVNKFSNITDLVKYIKRLDANVTEYMEYFEWKNKYGIGVSQPRALCDLCEKLNKPIIPKTYTNMKKSWYGEDHDMCRGPLAIVYTN